MSTDNEHFTELVTQVAALIDILLEIFAVDDGNTDDVGIVDDADIVAQGLERYARQVESIGMMAESGEFIGLSHVCRRYQQALEQLASNREALSEPVRVALEEWPTLVMAYLEAPTDAEASAALVAHLQNPAWVKSLSAEDAESLQQLLVQQTSTVPNTAATVSVAPDAETEAGLPEDVTAGAELEAMEPPLTDCATVSELMVYDEEPEDVTVLTASAPVDLAACDAEPEPEPEALAVVSDFASLEISGDDPVRVDTVCASTVDDEIPADGAACTVPDAPGPPPAEFDTTPASFAQEQSPYNMPFDGLAAACSDDRQVAYEVPSDALAAFYSDDRQEVISEEPEATLSEEPEAVEIEELETAAQKLVDLLSLEVTQLAAALEEALEGATADGWCQVLVDHTEEIERFGEGAAALGLQGLQQASEHIRAHLLSLVAQEQPLSEAQRQVVVGWPGPV